MPNRIWLCGDTHMHSSISDGKYAPDGLIKKCRSKGLDWIIITDHNKNAVGGKSYYSENLLVIPGAEYTGRNGHMNIFGSGLPEFDGTRPEKYEQYLSMSALTHSNGCTVSINHPFCSRFGWRMPLENFPADCVEIWNMFMHQSNMTCVAWWERQILSGRRISALGGSDYHRDYGTSDMLASPTTFVFAESNSEKDILSALRRGNSFITNSPDASRLILSYEDCVQGDEIKFSPGMKIHLHAERLRKDMTLRVFNNEKIVYEHRIGGESELDEDISIIEKGFVRAQITYRLRGFRKLFFDIKMILWRPKEKNIPYDTAVWCITNPMWVV